MGSAEQWHNATAQPLFRYISRSSALSCRLRFGGCIEYLLAHCRQFTVERLLHCRCQHESAATSRLQCGILVQRVDECLPLRCIILLCSAHCPFLPSTRVDGAVARGLSVVLHFFVWHLHECLHDQEYDAARDGYCFYSRPYHFGHHRHQHGTGRDDLLEYSCPTGCQQSGIGIRSIVLHQVASHV